MLVMESVKDLSKELIEFTDLLVSRPFLGPDSNYFRLWGIYDLCCKYSAVIV